MNHLIDHPIFLALGWSLLHFVWQACLIALTAFLALRVFAKAPSTVRYAIACAAFLLMAIVPCYTFYTHWEGGTVATRPAAQSLVNDSVSPTPSTQSRQTDSASALAYNTDPALAALPPTTTDEAPNSLVHSQWMDARTANRLSQSLRAVLPWLVLCWLSGVCLLSIRLALSWRKLRQLKTTGLQEIPASQQRILSELCKAFGIKHVVQIAHSTLIEVPTLVGWLQPIILLPMSTMSGLDTPQLRALLAHELAHVRRADFLINLLQTVIETLLFYHPAVWWLSNRIRQERENCCDDQAAAECQDGRSYVEALLRMEELRSFASPFAISAKGGSLTQRAARLLRVPDPQRAGCPQQSVGVAFLSLTLLAVVALAATSVLTSGNTQAAENEGEERMPEQVINEVPENVQTHSITISGKATNVDGEPVAGATIYVASHEEFHKLLKTTKTDGKGVYTFHDLELPIEKADGLSNLDSGRFEIYGTADNYAFAWRGQKSYIPDLKGNSFSSRESPDEPRRFVGAEKIEVDLVFAKPAPLSGTIVDESGNPISNTEIHLFNCWRAPTDKFSDLDMFQVDMSSLYSDDYCSPEISTVRSNEQGEFTFANAPPECRYRISVKPPKFAGRMMYATTESDPNATREETVLERDGMKLSFQSPREVTIRLVGLAKPEHGDGAHVNPYNKNAGASAVSDENGTASLKIPPGEYKVSILPPIGTPYWKTDESITVTKERTQVFELQMTPAAVVDIQAVDESGAPIKGASGFDLWVEKNFGGNKQRDIHYFRNYERENRMCHVHRVRTDEQGKLRANFLPGKYRIGIGSQSKPTGWKVVDHKGKEVDLKAGEPAQITIRVRPPDNGDF